MKNIIAFSLWGNDPKYTHGAIHNAKLAKYYYPSWICRYYVDETVPNDIIQELTSLGCEIHLKDLNINCMGTLWRYEVMFDDDVNLFMCRDTDSRITLREKLAVDEWLNSGKSYHVMRDHLHHSDPFWAILAGMFGGYVNAFKKYREAFVRYVSTPQEFVRGCDQFFLHNWLWNDVKHDMMCHDTYKISVNVVGCERDFPIPLIGEYHVGAVVDANDSWENIYEQQSNV